MTHCLFKNIYMYTIHFHKLMNEDQKPNRQNWVFCIHSNPTIYNFQFLITTTRAGALQRVQESPEISAGARAIFEVMESVGIPHNYFSFKIHGDELCESVAIATHSEVLCNPERRSAPSSK